MNYIKHLTAVLVEIYGDERLSPGHISLYLALFFYWNMYRFPKEFPVNRKELMKMAKIGSKSTYHRLLKQLDHMGYINYSPSHSPARSSRVGLSQNWDKSGTVMERSRSIFGRYCPISVPDTIYKKTNQTNKRSLGAQPRSQLEVLNFFKENGYGQEEAQRFFNHYQAIGWKIGGKISIVDWEAVAHNWMLKADEIKKATGTSKGQSKDPDHLMVETQKDYGQPL
ncbi:hypothetical protein K1F50_15200 [Muricauda oceani]|uniref:Uncharacterized protein n=1 Tax=Flagellimonas oceani TaxID=2698672 RepID=A0A6G7J3K2_9FLAO|nr:hypothetical protein [Allomuricauda oceani]MBW8244154.1 hypothetical protein [Allomuricauda oceani]QII45124.1 hypothetical protein GVT53_10670 [Allomuricauda oceani]